MLEINCGAKPVGIPHGITGLSEFVKMGYYNCNMVFHNPKTMQSISSLYG